jgi:hypothetical protein
MPLRRSEIARPLPPAEVVQVDALGGEVIVRGLLLSQRLEMAMYDGPRMAQVPHMLAICVVDADEQPVFTAAEWDAFGALHDADAMKLFAVAQRLSGFDRDEAEKK